MEYINIDKLKRIIADDKAIIDAELLKYMESDDKDLNLLYSAMNYSITAGGKRIRPFLAMEICRALGGDVNAAIPFACAVEMIHTYSLIHDDLPCMDNDDMRRGKPTNHKVYGDDVAILAGDALLTQAFRTMTMNTLLPAEAVTDGISLLSYYAGMNGMVGGQVLDMRGQNNSITEQQLIKIHSLKTGAMIKASALLGCISAGFCRNSNEFKAVEAYAEKVGLVFQITDDILDVESDAESLGKETGKDKRNGKTTFISFYTVNDAKYISLKLTNDAVAAITRYDKYGILTALAEYLCSRKN